MYVCVNVCICLYVFILYDDAYMNIMLCVYVCVCMRELYDHLCVFAVRVWLSRR